MQDDLERGYPVSGHLEDVPHRDDGAVDTDLEIADDARPVDVERPWVGCEIREGERPFDVEAAYLVRPFERLAARMQDRIRSEQRAESFGVIRVTAAK